MAISKIKATLYQDNKRNTATCYLKFNEIKEEIYVGFHLTSSAESFENQTAKTKNTKTLVSGIRAELIPTKYSDYLLSVFIDDQEYQIHLDSTGDYPITHIGQWEQTTTFNQWFNSHKHSKIFIKDFLDEK